jgi:hypothetical protein
MSPSRQNMKTGPHASVPPKMRTCAQNMKTGHDALGTAENESGHAKHEKRTGCPRNHRKRVRKRKTTKRNPTPSVPSKMSKGAQHMKKEPDASVPSKIILGTQNMKTGPDAIGTAENESGLTKHENGTGRHRYCRKLIRERKT